ncbi:MAG: DUF1275 domain-containing protein [Bacteroidetes bacterium]|nr:MAG: DUF1275 domain-containing protein [Bacteroidota bacterium]
MFQHAAKKERRFSHDIKLAALLATTAGCVNTAGFFAFEVLTTNVTGHVALMANELVANNWQSVYTKLLWIFLFFAGAFASSMMVQMVGRKHSRFAHTLPLVLEMIILIFVAYYGGQNYDYSIFNTELLAGSLLFAMGMQNAMVTIVSGSVIRTTHLTGLITDLGIEIAKAIMAESGEKRHKMLQKITLHGTIVCCFFLGGIVGGYGFANYLFNAFAIPFLILVFAMFYDLTYARMYMLKKRILKANLKAKTAI